MDGICAKRCCLSEKVLLFLSIFCYILFLFLGMQLVLLPIRKVIDKILNLPFATFDFQRDTGHVQIACNYIQKMPPPEVYC